MTRLVCALTLTARVASKIKEEWEQAIWCGGHLNFKQILFLRVSLPSNTTCKHRMRRSFFRSPTFSNAVALNAVEHRNAQMRAKSGNERKRARSQVRKTRKVKTCIPATEPPDPRRVSEGVFEGVSEGFFKGFEGVSRRTLQNPFKTPSRTLRKPFKKVSKSMMR